MYGVTCNLLICGCINTSLREPYAVVLHVWFFKECHSRGQRTFIPMQVNKVSIAPISTSCEDCVGEEAVESRPQSQRIMNQMSALELIYLPAV